MVRCCHCLALVLALLAPGLAATHAQTTTPPQAATPDNPRQGACPPEAGANAPTVGSGQSGPNLSDKLAQSNGIICPPAGVDSEMQVPAPNTGRMPVVPPPGTPGGDQRTVPK